MRVSTFQIRVPKSKNRLNSDNSIIESVKTEGVLEPLVVTNNGDGTFTLVAGHRRLASAIHFGIDMVPIHTIPPEQAEKARALENLDRKPLHPLDEAVEIRTLQSQGYDNNVISAMLGMPLSKVVRRAKLNNLSPKVRKAFQDGKMDAAAAEEFSIMELDVQDEIFGKVGGHYDPSPKQIRNFYLDKQGVSLAKCTDEFQKMDPQCTGCPYNVASDNTLFDGCDGTCKDVSCWCKKLEDLAKKENARIFVDSYKKDDRIEKQLKKNGVTPAKKSYYEMWPKKEGDHTVKMMDCWGNVRWAVPDEPKKKVNTEVEKQRKEIKKKYKALYEALQPVLGKMLFEHADAFMAKYHKDERFPDKDERVILAKTLYKGNMWRLDGFIFGKQFYGKSAPLEGMDNKRIFSVMYLWAATGAKEGQEIWPHDPEKYDGEGLLLPHSMDIEDLFQLKTSKSRKRAVELKEQMEQLLKEYNALEGK